MTASPPAPAALALSDAAIAKLAAKMWNELGSAEGSNVQRAFKAIKVILPDILAAIAAPAPAVVGEDAWQPIETAPKTTQSRLVWCPERKNIYAVTWCDGGFWMHWGGSTRELTEEPTHWRPMPAAPVVVAAPRPSRDACGEAVAWKGEVFIALGEADLKVARWSHGAEPWSYWSRESIERALDAHPPAPAAENGRVGELRAELTRIADDYHPDRPQDAALALDEMREAIRALLAKASPQ